MRQIALIVFFLGIVIYSCEKRVPYDLPEIEGKSLDAIYKEYGKPEYEYSFQLTDTLLEFRYGLLSKFPDRKADILIRELKFYNDGNEVFIWFYERQNQWVVVSSLVVPKGVKI